MRGQIANDAKSSFYRLAPGPDLRGRTLVYLLMTVNFQSWLDPFIILMALPGAHGRHRVDAVHHPDHASACRR
jgi:hypothetical protein